MAKVKITGHASGSGVITVTAPNTSTDRTITLPDNTGSLLTSSDDLPAANLTGTVATANIADNAITLAKMAEVLMVILLLMMLLVTQLMWQLAQMDKY